VRGTSRIQAGPVAPGAGSAGFDRGGLRQRGREINHSQRNWTKAWGTLNLYAYNAADQLVSAKGPGMNQSLTYDGNGNELSAGSRKYTYDLANRLTSVKGGGKQATYAYTGEGLLAIRSTPGQKLGYSWDTNAALPELAFEQEGGNTVRAYSYGLGRLGLVSNGASYSYHTDALGSIAEVSDGSGSHAESYRYAPYGSAFGPGTSSKSDQPSQGASQLNPIRFTGEYLDSRADLYQLRARQYDSELGRFLEVDPLGDDYLYAADRPSALTDPSGENPGDPFRYPNRVPGPKCINVTFAVEGGLIQSKVKPGGGCWNVDAMPWQQRFSGSSRWLICYGRLKGPSGTGPNWAYDEIDPSQPLDPINIGLCSVAASFYGQGRGYAFMSHGKISGWQHKGTEWWVTRYYAELYSGADSLKNLANWEANRSIGSPTLSVANRVTGGSPTKAAGLVTRLCNAMRSGEYMGIYSGGDGIPYEKPDILDAVLGALDSCTFR
jgi:RHS repeat-associated protein